MQCNYRLIFAQYVIFSRLLFGLRNQEGELEGADNRVYIGPQNFNSGTWPDEITWENEA